ncbi:kinase-like protein [Rhizopogon salebrosus TDB-379]|nr:kinase-like protein [Rhizopogon salebrosus TDB-379]
MSSSRTIYYEAALTTSPKVKSLTKIWTKVKATKTAFTFPRAKRAPVPDGGLSVVPIITPPTGAAVAPGTKTLQGITNAASKLAYAYVGDHGWIVRVYAGDSPKVIAIKKIVRKRAEAPLAEDVEVMRNSASIGTEALLSRDSALMETKVPALRNVCGFLDTRGFILHGRLGFGGFAVVYRAEDKVTGEVMALKVVNKCSAGPRQLYLARMEAYAMRRVMGDPYCMEIKAAFQDEHKLYMALAFYPGGDLWSVIDRCPLLRLPVDHARAYAAELLVGIHHIHRHGIIHRDIKPENILIDSHGHLVIADFGFAKVFPHAKPGAFSPYNPTGTSTSLSQAPYRTKGICGSPSYMAPEVMLGGWYGFAVDFWAVGVVLYEMLAGMLPFIKGNCHSQQDAITRFEPFFCEDFDPEAKDLLQKMLQKDVGSRPLHKAMLEHPFFASIDWQRVEERSFPPVYVPLTEQRGAQALSTPPPPSSQCNEPKGPLPYFNFISPTLKRQRCHVRWRIKVQKIKQILTKLAVKPFLAT